MDEFTGLAKEVLDTLDYRDVWGRWEDKNKLLAEKVKKLEEHRIVTGKQIGRAHV